MGVESNTPIPKYVIFGDPENPDIAALEHARRTSTCVRFAVFVAGTPAPQIICLMPIDLQYTPGNTSYCLIRGRVCSLGGATDAVIEGMYHLASRAYGGFDDL